jgi:hypothetical protein
MQAPDPPERPSQAAGESAKSGGDAATIHWIARWLSVRWDRHHESSLATNGLKAEPIAHSLKRVPVHPQVCRAPDDVLGADNVSSGGDIAFLVEWNDMSVRVLVHRRQ